MRAIITSTVIAAPADKIWDVLVDLDKYPDWNPLFKKATGVVAVDQKLAMSLRDRNLTIKPTLLVVTPGEELRWFGAMPIPGLFKGNHYHIITDNKDGTCTFEHGEHMSGCLVALLGLSGFFKTADKGYNALNKALKERCEETSPTESGAGLKSAE